MLTDPLAHVSIPCDAEPGQQPDARRRRFHERVVAPLATATTTPDIRSSPAGVSEPSLADELHVEIGLDCLRPALRSVARILDAAEWDLRQREAMMIDRNHAGLDRGGDRGSGLGRARVGVGG